MKTASAPLLALLNSFRSDASAKLSMADCFTITLASGSAVGLAGGTVLTYTNLDVDVALGGYIYSSKSVLIDGLKYKCSRGVDTDQQSISISAWPSMTIGGVPFLQAIGMGLLDGASIRRDRVFFSELGAVGPLTPVGSVILFQGRVSQVTQIGRTSAEVTVSSDLVLLSIDMPRNLYQPNCTHSLYDSGCGVSRAACTSAGALSAGSTRTDLSWAYASSWLQQGTITFTSGPNSGVTTTIKNAGTGWMLLAYPLPHAPGIGDTFNASGGCDHTTSMCAGHFSNLANFRGFPFVPPPQIITGPMSSTFTTTTGK